MQLEISAEDRSRGAIGIFSLTGHSQQNIHVSFSGADASEMYRVSLDNTGMKFEVPGSELLSNGISIQISSSLSSELITYEAIR